MNLIFHNKSLEKQFLLLLIVLILNSLSISSYASNNDNIVFDDKPLGDALVLPEWFNLSFLELAADIQDAKEQNKKGLILYFVTLCQSFSATPVFITNLTNILIF